MASSSKSPKSDRKSQKKMEKKHKRKHPEEGEEDDAAAVAKDDDHDVKTNLVKDTATPEKEAANNDDSDDDDDHRSSSKKKKKKKTKKHHRKEEENEDDDKDNEEDEEEEAQDESSKNKKKSKRKRSDNDDDEEKEEDDNDDDDKDDKKESSKRKLRILERQRLLEELPKVDPETGISFTKQQLRRMRKRLQRGLNPIETPREKHERMMNRAQDEKREQDEWADMIVVKPGHDEDDDDDDAEAEDESDDDIEQDGGDANADEEKSSDIKSTKQPHDAPSSKQQPQQEQQQPKAKLPRGNKPVPSDYICQACKNKHQPAHWIYDCPDKVTVRGTNNKKRHGKTVVDTPSATPTKNNTTTTTKGIHDPDGRKVFISGLPFDTKTGDIIKLFASHKCGKVVNCRMIKFEDTGRCKGQAYVTLESEELAQKACSLLNGIAVSNETAAPEDGTDSKRKSKKPQPQRKEPLKLTVTKVLNRLATKKRQ